MSPEIVQQDPTEHLTRRIKELHNSLEISNACLNACKKLHRTGSEIIASLQAIYVDVIFDDREYTRKIKETISLQEADIKAQEKDIKKYSTEIKKYSEELRKLNEELFGGRF